ncbi:ATPase, vacuolar ER assembly factor, Vma [Parasponia andersonii]|uniref:ATPase, vacuolar ER assembly factor, Vma n=1 Tax=Parasponia andersonii TaxID=3476 RepID=A0A2P5BHS0_PARAD|nr:ATPase, vacuolar ER assembly factor, Vma [Parasponia andersonii]
MATELRNPPGVVISMTEPIRSFLTAASRDPSLSQELQEIASDLSSKPNVPYKPLRTIWSSADITAHHPSLIQLLSGSEFVLTSPKPREKSEELKARLRKLAEMAERNAYAELVKDITPKKETTEPFSSYKDQLGFGLHVALTMFTGYLVGYAAFRALFNHSPAMNAAGGILGLIGGMLVETFLFIIRTSSQELRNSASASKQKKDQ